MSVSPSFPFPSPFPSPFACPSPRAPSRPFRARNNVSDGPSLPSSSKDSSGAASAEPSSCPSGEENDCGSVVPKAEKEVEKEEEATEEDEGVWKERRRKSWRSRYGMRGGGLVIRRGNEEGEERGTDGFGELEGEGGHV